MEQLKISELYSDLSKTLAKELLESKTYPWEVLPCISEFIVKLGNTLSEEEYEKKGENVWIAKSAKVAPTAYINGPVIIGKDAEVRHCAFIRGNALVGAGAVVGNSVELKNCILFDQAQVPHFNYVGDSILGYKAHLGAGAVTSNLKSDRSLVVIRQGEERLPTGRKKLGALVGDEAEVGCNSVLCPGSVLGRSSQVYPTSCVRGVVPAHHIYKDAQRVVPRCTE